MVFAVGYGTLDQDMNNYVLIGNYAFSNESVVAEYKEFDANANSKPTKTALRHDMRAPYGGTACQNKLIDIPTESAQRFVKGTWSSDSRTLSITLGALTYEWTAENGAEGGYELSRIKDNVLDVELPLAVGYGYASASPNKSITLRKENFFPYYYGDYFHKDNNSVAKTPWKAMPTGLKIAVFVERENGNVLSYVSPSQSQPTWVQNSILLNQDSKSGFILNQDLGHDFNKNGCYDEYGHNRIILGANDSDDSFLYHMVIIEYSYAFDGFPMLSVGRFHNRK
ncbi:hypothetical protein [Nitrospira sp. Nam74]